MFLSSCCVIYCPTPQGQQGQFALKRPAIPVKEVKANRSWSGRRSVRPVMSHAYAAVAGD